MNLNNLTKLLMGCLAFIGLTMQSCSSSEEPANMEGTGSITLSVTTQASFTKAIDESTYGNVNNYTVQILNNDGVSVKEFLYSDKPDKINLNNGTYTLKAFYGTESNASRDGFYVEGSNTFQVDGEPVQQVSVTCAPTCGKVAVKFASNMSEYFSDYSVVYETAALKAAGSTAVWAKGDTEPWYLKVDPKGETVTATIQFTRLSDNKPDSEVRTYTLAPSKSWTLSIAPQDNNGSIDIDITIDESTDDEEIDIEVPSEWL